MKMPKKRTSLLGTCLTMGVVMTGCEERIEVVPRLPDHPVDMKDFFAQDRAEERQEPDEKSRKASEELFNKIKEDNDHPGRFRGNEAGAGQPASKPADKVPAKVQPSIPTPKDGPR